MKKAHRSEFLKAIKDRFPELVQPINQENGLLVFELFVFTTFTQAKIDLSDEQVVSECFDILNYYYINGNKTLRHVIGNAVGEDLVFTNNKDLKRSWAVKLLPASLKSERDAWFTMMGYSLK